MKDLVGLEYLGKIYVNKGLWDKAYLAFKKYITWVTENKISSENLSEVLCLYGQCASKLGRLTEAKEAYLNSINLSPENNEAYFKLGLMYEKLGLFKEEEVILIKGLSACDVKDSALFNHIAFALFNQRNYIEAAGYLAMAAIRFPTESFLDEIAMCEKYWREKNDN